MSSININEDEFQFPYELFNAYPFETNLRNTFLTKDNELPDEYLYTQNITLITSGLIMLYWEDEDGIKTIIDFRRNGEVLRPAVDLADERLGIMRGVTMKDTKFIMLDKDFFCSCSLANKEVSTFYYELLTKDISSTYRQLKLHKETNLEKRYGTFLNEYSEIYNDITDRMVANYLGVHFTTLSRLKSKMLKDAKK